MRTAGRSRTSSHPSAPAYTHAAFAQLCRTNPETRDVSFIAYADQGNGNAPSGQGMRMIVWLIRPMHGRHVGACEPGR